MLTAVLQAIGDLKWSSDNEPDAIKAARIMTKLPSILKQLAVDTIPSLETDPSILRKMHGKFCDASDEFKSM